MNDLTQRTEGARYEILLDDDNWWELGWDPVLATYFAQRWTWDAEVAVSEWYGAQPGELADVTAVEAAIGLAVSPEVRAELEADRAAAALGQGR